MTFLSQRNTMYYGRKAIIITTISLRLNDSDFTLFKKYAQMHNVSISELVRRSVLEKIEDEYDFRVDKKKFRGM